MSEIDLEQLADEVQRENRAKRRRRIPVEKSIQRIAIVFWKKVARGADSDCWPWTGFKKSSGHGLTSYKSAPIHASRKAYILTHGPIEIAKCVLHRCDNAACCNPSHLYLGSRADNMIDRFGNVAAADRSHTGRNRVLTDEQIEVLWQMRREGAKLKECATKFDVHIATICRYITARRKLVLAKLQARRHSVSLRKTHV